MNRIAYIRWRDACSEAAEESGPVIPGLVELDEVGWFVGETDEVITIVMEMEPSYEGEPAARPGRWRLHIPKNAIIEMRVMEASKAFPKRSKRQ
jgi:hypothetical protein